MASVRIVSRDNGVGLSRDMALVATVMRDAGHCVEVVGYGKNQLANRAAEAGLWLRSGLKGRVDLQIFLERVYQRCLPFAHRNVLVPNPEWFSTKWMSVLPRFDSVLCKTRHAARIFDGLGCRTRHVGFTSEDLYDPSIPRERAFFHLAGRSIAKGTHAVIEAWEQHPEWPLLTVVQHPRLVKRRCVAPNVSHVVDYVDAATLKRMQNSHRFHLCPSETEGFGHYLVEGMGVGAVVITTDGAPMNELVTPETGLLAPVGSRECRGLVEHFIVDVAGVEAAVVRAISLDDAECVRIGEKARRRFKEMDLAFRNHFERACFEY